MNAGQLRRVLRAGHIVVGVLLSIYVYSPLHADPLLTDIIRYLAIPVIVLSGVAIGSRTAFLDGLLGVAAGRA